ncbi:MAG: acetyl-CoA decarbonylase/synthase complex subunit delta [Oscillospiraceae bacterium]|jgi:acetyl-CoA decarbonylase/synthase complex subunit delta|nr:acetyl-CoA decarbonylase/synthase complex subunit delta [Oscillospiraceae bacterium]
MAFKATPQKFTAKINALTVGTGDREISLGGENVFPFYSFDAPIENSPKIGIEIHDAGHYAGIPGMDEYYAGADTLAETARRAAAVEGADFLAVSFDGAHPDGGDRSVEDCVAVIKEIADAVDIPIVIEGSKSIDKDVKLFDKISEALSGRNILVLSAREENYKSIAASVGLAYSQKVGAESAVDINLAKQLNVLISQMGVKSENTAMNLGSAAAGYGFEYVASTIDRVKAAALAQNDMMLQMPIVTPVGAEAWSVKEAIVSEEDFPEWGPMEIRGINMEVSTAAACLAAGSNAVILRHPESVKAVSRFIKALI